MNKDINGYELSRKWFDFAFDNPEKIRPVHGIVYFFIIEHNNRLGWREKFGLPSQMVMDAVGIKNWKTYINAVNDLENFGFIKFIERSKNQYSSNIIALVKNNKATTKALSKAMSKHSQKQVQSIVSINKPVNQRTKEPVNPTELEKIISFWNGEIEKQIEGKNITLKTTNRTSNPSCRIGESIMMRCKKINQDIEKSYQLVKKSYDLDEIYHAIFQYAVDISKRKDDRDEKNYCSHRFSFRDFLKQKNGLLKFVNYDMKL